MVRVWVNYSKGGVGPRRGEIRVCLEKGTPYYDDRHRRVGSADDLGYPGSKCRNPFEAKTLTVVGVGCCSAAAAKKDMIVTSAKLEWLLY